MTKKTRLIPFDLQKWRNDYNVVCRDGRQLVFIAPDSEKITIVILDEKHKYTSYILNLKGRLRDHADSGCDLLLEDKEMTFYVQINPCEQEDFKIYKTYEEAYENSSKYLIGILKVTYTDEDLIK
jgi:hypothetical protein